MSSRKGEDARKRAQKYQNTFAFKNNLHDNSERTKRLNQMSINEVCQKCRDVIEWKIKYRKYKALKAPASCNKCLQRNVKKAYHVLCRDCAISSKQCAKCLVHEGEDVKIIPPEPSDEEKLRQEIEMKQLIKFLPERKRRTFLRFMRGKKKKTATDENEEEIQETETKPSRTREELLEKIEKLKLETREFSGVLDSDDEESYDSEGSYEDDEDEDE